MNHGKTREESKWLACILVIFSLTLLVGQNLFAQEYGLGDIRLPRDVYEKHLRVYAETVREGLPSAYDARNEGIVTPAKNQGYCGSCWAFASVGAMESHLLKKFGFGPEDLSEQEQVSCNGNMWGCCGGTASAIRYWETNGPIYETCFPYGDFSTSCPIRWTLPCSDSEGCEELVYRVVGWHTVDGTQFKASLYNNGPSYWRFDVYSDFFTFWNGGSIDQVYVQKGGVYEGGHAVLLIGWDDSKGAYLCKNSWGENSGPNHDGTFWIAYTGHIEDLGFEMSNFDVTGGCGDGTCDPGENPCNCPEDCGTPPPTEVSNSTCNDGLDNDCDGDTDCDDSDCDADPACVCDNDGVCEDGEDCDNCPGDCISGTGAGCGNGVCEPDEEENCISCPEDCAGKQVGKPSKRFCCGDGDGVNPVGCDDPQCNSGDYACGETPPPFCCGDTICEGPEDVCNCAIDCGDPPASEIPGQTCNDGLDNDCDGAADCDDPDGDCDTDSSCECLPRGEECSIDDECCSNRCHRGRCK